MAKRIPIFWGVIVFVIGLAGFYVGILSIVPRLSVSHSEELKQYDPFSVPFVITNDGYLPIHSVNMACSIDHMLLSSGSSFVGVVTNDSMEDAEISPGGHSTHFCPVSARDPGMQEIIITATISFRPDLWPWRTSKQFHFRGYKGDDGVMHWSPLLR
jgi:hypothetical protein